MGYYEAYEDNPHIMKLIKLGRDMISACEYDNIFKGEDAKWNACVTAGNKLTTVGTPWGIKSIEELTEFERKIMAEYLDEHRVSKDI
jgi:hypothetical protein